MGQKHRFVRWTDGNALNTSVFSVSQATPLQVLAKNPALGPSAKYSSHADESTTFTLDPCPDVPWCRFPSRSPTWRAAIERE